MTAQDQLRTNLEQLRDIHKTPPQGYVYRGAADFVLRHGTFYSPRLRPIGVKQGAPNCCYGNAIGLAATRGWKYIEGYATIAGQGFPLAHGWNLDDSGLLVDCTWPTPGLAYMGVEFSLGRADDASWSGDACVLDDWKRGWPLFQQEWNGEDWNRVWEPSLVLLAFRQAVAEGLL